MARASLTKQAIDHQNGTLTRTAPTGAGAGNGWTFANTGAEIFECKNTDSSSKTLTLKANGKKVGGISLQDVTVTVAAASGGAPGYAKVKLPVDYFGSTAQIDVSDATGVTGCIFR